MLFGTLTTWNDDGSILAGSMVGAGVLHKRKGCAVLVPRCSPKGEIFFYIVKAAICSFYHSNMKESGSSKIMSSYYQTNSSGKI